MSAQNADVGTGPSWAPVRRYLYRRTVSATGRYDL